MVHSWATARGALPHPEDRRERAEGKSGGQQVRDAGGMVAGAGRRAQQTVPGNSAEEYLAQDGC